MSRGARSLSLLLWLLSACSAKEPAPPDMAPPPFEAVPVATYTAKVKSVLTGLPPTDAEVAAVRADPQRLPDLIDGWMALPQFQQKMLAFFEEAFQQTQLSLPLFDDQLAGPLLIVLHPAERNRMLKTMRESFPRTALQLIAEGRPFHEVLTTRRFMLNAPLMTLLSYMDAAPTDDAGQERGPDGPLSWMIREDPGFTYRWQHNGAPIPLEESIDPTSPHYLHFYDPNPMMAAGQNIPCSQDPATVATDDGLNFPLGQLMLFLFGIQPRACGTTRSQFTPADYDTWRMVTVRPPRTGERRTRFFDLPLLRATDELVLDTPRVGFMTTPAFFANYPTNDSNSARVTVNQMLIVGLGKTFSDAASAPSVATDTDPSLHAQPGTPCYGCHVTLDPMRAFFRQSYTLNYHRQADAAQLAQPAAFSLEGLTVAGRGHGIADLAEAMAAHPRFAPAWTQKLCRYADSVSCDETDPEFQRVAQVFQRSGFQWRALVRELFSSPLVTGAARTQTFTPQGGQSAGIALREHLCVSLQSRLGVADACGLQHPDDPMLQQARNLAMAVPGAGYARGAEVPLLPRDPNLFSDAAVENLCGLLADQLVDAGPTSRYAARTATRR